MPNFITAIKVKNSNTPTRTILHLDLDAFFASCEEARNPRLKYKLVVIGSDPKKGRGVVSTCNYESRKYGIKSAMPITWACKRCPKAVFLPVDGSYYSKISKRIMSYLESTVKKFEQASIDEAYLDISHIKNPKRFALKIQKTIKQREKITCSIGVGTNKLIAKVASDFKKPNSITLVKPYETELFLNPLKVSKLPGIGPKTTLKLRELDVTTVEDLNKIKISKLLNNFGNHYSFFLKRISAGLDYREVAEPRERKSMGSEITFDKDLKDKKILFSTINKIVETNHNRLRNRNLFYQTIKLKVRYEDFQTFTTQKTARTKIYSHETSKQIAKKLLKKYLKDKRKIRLVGVSFSKLT